MSGESTGLNKYPMLKKYKIEVYYTQIGPIVVPSQVESVIADLDAQVNETEVWVEVEAPPKDGHQ